MTERLFLSYSTQDAEFARTVVDRSKTHGIAGVPSSSEFYDPRAGADPRQDVRQKIMSAIQGSTGLLAIWSSNASTSPWCHYELGVAAALGKPITIITTSEHAPQLPADVTGYRVVKLGP